LIDIVILVGDEYNQDINFTHIGKMTASNTQNKSNLIQ
jgi:hypothetical protein